MRPFFSHFVQTLALGALALVSGCQSAPPLTGRVETQTVTSALVTSDSGAPAQYTILVRLPPGYDTAPTSRYPVIYQLDAIFLDEFQIAAGIASELAEKGAIPEAIVVGIGHPPGGSTPERDRDFTLPGEVSTPGNAGHADRFLAFLGSELLPKIDQQYRTDPARGRTLSGHSSGGAFALYSFLSYKPDEPALFEHTIAADFGYDSSLFTLESELAARSSARPGSLFFTHAIFNGAGQKVTFDAMVQRVTSRNYAGLRIGAAELDTDHLGAIAKSIEPGLAFGLGGGK